MVVVYDTGRQVLDDGAKIRDFCGYWEILKTHQGELSQAGVDLSGLPMDRSAADFEAAYYKEADINLKVIRESGDHLQDAVTGGTEQVGLIGETERLSQYVKGHAADAAWEKYKTNTEQLQANLQKLKDAQEAVKGVDDNLYFGLNKKQDEYTAAITLMIEGTIQNNPTDFANRLTTGAAAISANNTGVEGSDKHLYAWHGSPGVNWPARQVKDDLRTSVIGAFATAIAAFNDANTSMDQFVTDNYTILRQALNIGENGPAVGNPLTPEEQDQVGQWSQYSLEAGGGDCSRWALASALANKYGTREGPNGKEINLPADVQNKLMDGMPLHFPPNRAEIDQITRWQGVQIYDPGTERDGFPGGPGLMTQQLQSLGIDSAVNNATSSSPEAVTELTNQMTADLQAGRQVIVNGSVSPGGGHFLSISRVTFDDNGQPQYWVNDSNRTSAGTRNGGTLPYPCDRATLERFLRNRTAAPPGYSTVPF